MSGVEKLRLPEAVSIFSPDAPSRRPGRGRRRGAGPRHCPNRPQPCRTCRAVADVGAVYGAGGPRAAARYAHQAHQRRTGGRRHIHRHGDCRITRTARKRIAARASVGGTRPPRARHRGQGQSNRKRFGYRHCSSGRPCPGLVRYRQRIRRPSLPRREGPILPRRDAQRRSRSHRYRPRTALNPSESSVPS